MQFSAKANTGLTLSLLGPMGVRYLSIPPRMMSHLQLTGNQDCPQVNQIKI